MDSTLTTPLLDLFRRGEVPRDVRLLAARGEMALRADERIGLLVILVGDPDVEIAAAAEATLGATPREWLGAFLARAGDVSAEVRELFGALGARPAEAGAPVGDAEDLDAGGASDSPPEEEPPQDGTGRQSVFQKIASLNVAARMALAMKGTREERAILVRDPNKIVGAAVLSSPKLSETEVEGMARATNVSEDILRMIGYSRAWTKNYSIVLALVKNPKTPLALSMGFLPRLVDKDLRMLSSNRNVPEALRVTARKKVVIVK